MSEPTDFISIALNFAAGINRLSSWAAVGVVVVGLIYLSWKAFLSSMIDRLHAHKLELRTVELSKALEIQRDAALKRIEFQQIKLNKTMPLLEKMNGCAYTHRLLVHGYTTAIINRYPANRKAEELRVSTDKEFLEAMTAASIYLPREFRNILSLIRNMISCYFFEPKEIYEELKSLGPMHEQMACIRECHTTAISCFIDMCEKYLGVQDEKCSYEEILKRHGFSENGTPISDTPLKKMAWKVVLLHEMHSESTKSDVLDELEEYFERLKPNPSLQARRP
ncbi:MAG: hypothetical protein IPH23_10510 [Gammaproteobacteria bacterium]|nr:hypothetical protein [Gammaproteobacteria bacterium]